MNPRLERMFPMAHGVTRVIRRIRWTDQYRRSKSQIPPHFQVIERLGAQHGIDADGIAALKRGLVKQWFQQGKAARDYVYTWWVDPCVILELPREMFARRAEPLPALRPGEWNIRDIRGRKVRLGKAPEPADRMKQAEKHLRNVARSLLLEEQPPYRVVSLIVRCAEGINRNFSQGKETTQLSH